MIFDTNSQRKESSQMIRLSIEAGELNEDEQLELIASSSPKDFVEILGGMQMSKKLAGVLPAIALPTALK